MNQFRYFFLGLVVTFGLPWYVLVVKPYVAFSQLEPVAYNPDRDEVEGTFPGGRKGGAAMGREVYKQEGCAECHTQVIRPQYASGDGDAYKRAFGLGEDGKTAVYTRESTPYDYIGDDVALIGQVRNGPDLANVGVRVPDEAWHYRHLYNPRAIHDWSTMPAFRHLFERRVVQGAPSEFAVEISEKDGVLIETVPSQDAEALVSYLLTLGMAEPLPVALKGDSAAAGGGGEG